nr:hypothetical protein [Streptomyces parvus]
MTGPVSVLVVAPRVGASVGGPFRGLGAGDELLEHADLFGPAALRGGHGLAALLDAFRRALGGSLGESRQAAAQRHTRERDDRRP